MLADSRQKAIREFVGKDLIEKKGPLYVVGFYPAGTSGFFTEVHAYLASLGLRAAPSYLTRSKDGGWGSLPPVPDPLKLLLVDQRLDDPMGAHYAVAKRLVREKLTAPDRVSLAVERYPVPGDERYGLFTVDDLLLFAYDSGREMKPVHLGDEVKRFAEKHLLELTEGGKPSRVVAPRSLRRVGLGVALALDRKNRKLYLENPNGSEPATDDDRIVRVYQGEDGKPEVELVERQRILIVEGGDKAFVDSAVSKLREMGYLVEISGNPEDGRKALRSGKRHHLAITGDFDLARNCVDHGLYVFILAEGQAGEETYKRALEAGVSRVLEKPVAEGVLEEAVRKALG